MKLEIHRFTCALLGALALVPLTGFAADVRTPLEEKLDPIFEYWNKPGSPGIAVTVVQDRKVLYTGAFGLANLEFGLPITPQTAFNAGSIAKQFTATAVLMLEAESKLSLDDEIHRYVSELPDFGHRITLRQLLNHTSGLRDIWALTDLAGWMPADVRTQGQALRLLSRQKVLNFTPGSSFSYSNSGYIMLAEVVARVSGRTFPAWINEHLFVPLGMTGSYFYQDHTLILPGSSSSYRSRGRDKGFARDTLNSGLVGGSNLVTTLADLAKWADYLISAEIGGQPLLVRLSDQATLPVGIQTGYGMGLFVESYRGLPVVHHGGASAGYRSHLLVFVDERLSAIILGNVNTVRANELAREIADVVLSERFTVSPPDTVPKDAEPALPYGAFTGLYALGPNLLLDVREADGRLFFLFGGTSPREMFPSGPRTFVTSEKGVSLTFTLDRDRTVSSVVMQVPGRKLEGRRLEPLVLTPKQLRAYEGTYFSDELEAFYHIVSDEGGLIVERLRGVDIALTPIGDDRFIESGPGGFTLRFKRKRSGRVRGFELSVERARHIEFDRQ